MIRRQILTLALAIALLPSCRASSDTTAAGSRRIVSLAPAVTETLFAIGAGPEVVAISDFCDSPEQALDRPRVGTSITPNYEAIAKLEATLIVSESNASTRRRELEALAPTRLLPWLTLSEIGASIRELGRLSGRAAPANALADTLLRRLDVPEPAAGPRVLLLLGGDSTPDGELWFIRRNSLHGAALRAAGGRNAVAEDVTGLPQLSFERLLELDPEVILILSKPRPGKGPPALAATLARFPTLAALRRGRVSALEAPEAFANGPRILALVDRLQAELARLGVAP